MEYDPDDVPPQWSVTDYFWHVMNRVAEWAMFTARLYGWKEVMMFYCDHCGNPEAKRKKFQDPRRGHGEEIAYIYKFVCCDYCELKVIEKLENTSDYLRLAYTEKQAGKTP